MRRLLVTRCLPALLIGWMLLPLATAKAEEKTSDGVKQRTEVYKKVGDVELTMHIYEPADHTAQAKSPAIVFFFGGGWTSGSPKQFFPHCELLAKEGMVAMAAEYRVASRHKVKADSCVADAKSAVRWARANAERLGIDPQRIAAGGGSAGGHLAACTAAIDGFEESSEDATISSRPDALVLFNPAVILAPEKQLPPAVLKRMNGLAARMGTEPENLSPYHHLHAKMPPTIIFHGKADETVPYVTVERYAEKMRELGCLCKLVGYDDAGHGFFNQGRGDNSAYQDTTKQMTQFLRDQGFL
ncbi:alpha/beta hydrolase [Blastopirellula sp. JC732]|uniref:Alpha/beta hydrolase n=1 Tax=Blastopirellula sediminis TaxID=2894196 RepID=A0A9X1MNC2_9BACT|nr:alpha/beta hydrolase [Blastopirellula sediminis]MCC9606379.1 alpha/beta hydrolase [Blastopirellula sediminis]MCC9630323.1 alpha/beta hydrolase [Blastopirellula sediminis]